MCWPPAVPFWALTGTAGFPASDPVAPPSVQAFTTRYPMFANVDQGLLAAILSEAANEVDTSWRQADQIPAIMAFAAHLLVSQGLGSGSVDVGGVSMDVAGPITSYQAGDTKISFAGSATSKAALDDDELLLSRTVYGLRFMELRDRNRLPAVAVV